MKAVSKPMIAGAGLALSLAAYTLVVPLHADPGSPPYYCCQSGADCGGVGSGYGCAQENSTCDQQPQHYGLGNYYCEGLAGC